MKTATLLSFGLGLGLLLSAACVPCPEPIDCETFIVCDDLNRCWARAQDWSVAAQWADPDDVQAGVDSGTLTPVDLDDLGEDVQCYVLDGADYHPCVVQTDCAPLLGRPLAEIDLTESDCAPIDGPWTQVYASENGDCWGQIGGLVVALSIDV